MKALMSYLRGVRSELSHVVWPNTRQAIIHVVLIVVISGVTAALIAGLDYGFTSAVNYAISR